MIHIDIKNQSGQLLMEILVSIAVGGMFILGATVAIVSVIKNNFENRGNQTASSLALDLANKVESFTNNSWHNIYDLNKGSSNQYFLVSSSTASVAVAGQESILYNDINSGLVGHWKMDESSGSVAYDHSGSFNTGTLYGSPTGTASSSCAIGRCLSFDNSDYVATSPWNDPRDNFSWSLWINSSINLNTSMPVNYVAPLGAYISSGNRDQIYYTKSGGAMEFSVGVSNSFTTTLSYVNNFNSGQWYYVSVVRNGNEWFMYVNGDVVDTGTSAVVSTAGSRNTEIAQDGVSTYFGGLIDDVRVYNRALSAQEIKQIYNSSVYNRYFYIENVQRDGSNNIVTSGTDDPSTQKVVSAVEWQDNRNLKFSNYLTRYKNDVFSQYDWLGGSAGDATTSSIINTFATSTNITGGLSLTLTSTATSGDLTSLIYDSEVTGGSSLNSILWQGTKPDNTTVKFQMATSSSSGGPWTYVGSDGTGSSYYTPTNSDISQKLSGLYNARYFRYKIFLTPDSGNSPTVDDVHLNWSR